MTAQILKIRKAAEAAQQNRQTAITAVATARKAAAEALQKKSEAKALVAEALELRDSLGELRTVENYLDEAGKTAFAEAKARLAEITAEVGEVFDSLSAEITADAEERDRRLFESTLARQDAEAKAKKAKVAAEKKAKELSEDILRWLRATGKSRLGLVTDWAGEGLAKSGVLLEKSQSEKGQTLVKVSAVRGETNLRVGQEWVATYSGIPMSLRKGLVKAGWVSVLPAKSAKAAPAAQAA